MSYEVILTQNAKSNLRHYYRRAAKLAPDTAKKWLDRFEQSLQTLSTRPERCQLAPESEQVSEEIREFLFGKRIGTFRVLFTISDSQVLILHIRRAVMDQATANDLFG